MIPAGAFLDPFGILSSLMKVHKGWIEHPGELIELLNKTVSELSSSLSQNSRALFSDLGNSQDKSVFLNLSKSYSRLAQELHDDYARLLKQYFSRMNGSDPREEQCLSFLINQMILALSPSNYFWTNPVTVEKFINNNGASLLNGMRNLIEDLARGDFLISITDMAGLTVGRDLANTPGFVVYRNDLMEVIQYSPSTKEVHAVPIIFVQAWINKYYIVDLTEENSLVRYLVDKGFTVFMISWKNPGPDMRHIGFDDYVIRGALEGIEVARDICGVEQVHAIGYCVGGTVLAALMAWLNRGKQVPGLMPIKHWTLLATVVDFSEPGEIDVYLTESSIRILEEIMQKDGYLPPSYLAMAVRLLRSDALVWRYYVHNYLQGEKPPKSEFLFWHSDHTRIPAAAGSFLLRELYMQNNLVKQNKIVLANRPLDLGSISQPLFAVGAEQDHLSPWKGTFRICGLISAPTRYILAREGHVTGFINPPSPRNTKKYLSGDVSVTDPYEWVASQKEKRGSWWLEWAEWLAERCGRLVPPPAGHTKYPPIEKAPGSYVMEQ